MPTDAPRDDLLRFLSSLDSEAGGYALVKTDDLWGAFERSGDWDIAVNDPACAASVLIRSCGRPRHVLRWPSGVALYYKWGVIDLVSRFGWRGIEIIDTRRLIDDASRKELGVAIARPAHQAVAGWILPALSSGSFNDRYGSVVDEALAEDRAEFGALLSEAFGQRLAYRLFRAADVGDIAEALRLARGLRLAVLMRSLRRRPLVTLRDASRHVLREFSLRFTPPMPSVAAAGEFGVHEAVRWAADNPRVVNGVFVQQGRTGYLEIATHSGRDGGGRRIEVRQVSAPSHSGFRTWWRKRTLRTRGWIIVRVRYGAAGCAGETYDRLEGMLSRSVDRCLSQLFGTT